MRENVIYKPKLEDIKHLVENKKIINVFTRGGSYKGTAVLCKKNSIQIGDDRIPISEIFSVRFFRENGLDKKSYYDFQESRVNGRKRR